VTDASYVFLAIAAAFALGDWYAVTRDAYRLEYVCKPATLVALIAVAVAADPDIAGRRAAFVVALALSLLGDIFLMLRRERDGLIVKGMFVQGLGAFLLAHLAYIVGFQIEGGPVWAVFLLFVAVRVASLPVTVRLLAAIDERGCDEIAPAVRAYALVICGMVAAAAATGDAVAIVGAVLFFASDLMIAWSRFVTAWSWAPLAIIVTYHLGQAALVLSLV
jgi:uncharacterized membrane protein YhhN